jgi:hypothetical protein
MTLTPMMLANIRKEKNLSKTLIRKIIYLEQQSGQ